MRWSKEDLVAQANFWITTVCRQQEVPGIQAKTLGKMGLRGVSGSFLGGGGVMTGAVWWCSRMVGDMVGWPRTREGLHENGDVYVSFLCESMCRWQEQSRSSCTISRGDWFVSAGLSCCV